MDAEDIIPALATWLADPPGMKLAAVTIPFGTDAQFVTRAVDLADVEPIYVTMHGLAGIDLAAAVQCPIAVTFRKKVVVVFDYDAIVANDPQTAATIAAAMKTDRVPFVVVANAFRGKTELPKGHWAIALRASSSNAAAAPVVRRKDKGLAGAEAALSGNVTEQYRGDGIALGAVFDNYLEKPIDALYVADYFSAADVIGEQLCRAGEFEDPFSFMPITAAALEYERAGHHLGPISTFGTVWSKTNAMYAKLKNARDVALAFTAAGSRLGAWTPITGIDLVRAMLCAAAPDVERLAAIGTSLGVSPGIVLLIMRLWKTKYTLSTHGKVKRAMQNA
jgi:hypothetical protein